MAETTFVFKSHVLKKIIQNDRTFSTISVIWLNFKLCKNLFSLTRLQMLKKVMMNKIDKSGIH